MSSLSKVKVLIVGIGNTIRADDGIGAYVCSAIDEMNIDGIETLIVQQLDTGLVDEFLKVDKIVLVDASVKNDGVNFYPLKNEESFSISSSHHLNANLLSSLIRKLYEKEINVMLCAVKGEDFDIGEQLSLTARQNAEKAVDLIVDWIKNSD